MIALICGKISIYSFPLGGVHKIGYDALVKRVCQVESLGKRWTGMYLVGDHVLTTGFYPHTKEFDIEFPDGIRTSGFVTEDWGEVIELGVAKPPQLKPLYSQFSTPEKGQILFVIGSILGIPYTLAQCEVETVLITEHVMDEDRIKLLDEHSAGSPVFNTGGAFVGILEAYIESTDKIIVRSFTSSPQGLLKG